MGGWAAGWVGLHGTDLCGRWACGRWACRPAAPAAACFNPLGGFLVAAELPDVRTSTPVASVQSLGPEGPVEVQTAGAPAWLVQRSLRCSVGWCSAACIPLLAGGGAGSGAGPALPCIINPPTRPPTLPPHQQFFTGGAPERFDAVLLATHSDISLKLLGGGGPEGLREVLAAIPYNENPVFLHSDETLMPK